jgi:hypothetical protein
MAIDPMLTAYFKGCVSPLSLPGNGSINMFPWERIRTIQELLEASVSIRSVLYEMRGCDSVYCRIVAGQWLGKNFPAARKYCWKRHFYPVHVASKESRQSVLRRTSCKGNDCK